MHQAELAPDKQAALNSIHRVWGCHCGEEIEKLITGKTESSYDVPYAEVYAWVDALACVRAYFTSGACAETSGAFVARLPDLRWIAFSQDEDTTGHGCMCGSSCTLWESEDDAWKLGLGERDREEIQKERACCES